MKDFRILIAAFVALFVVLSPVVHNLALKPESPSPNPGFTETGILPIEDIEILGRQAPNPEMRYLKGDEVDLESFRGKTVVFYLWSTWAPPSPRGMWFMNKLHTTNTDPDLVILAANIGYRDRIEEIERFVNRRDLTVPVVTCTPDVLAQFNVRGIPASFIIDSQGIIRHEDMGLISEKEFNKRLKQILEEEKKEPVDAE